MNTLIWKEWRENRMIIAFASLLMLVLFVGAIALQSANNGEQSKLKVDSGTFEAILAFVWYLSAGLCASAMVAPEVGTGTLQFLSSLPISRKRIWWTKLGTALGIHTLACLASGIVYMIAYSISDSNGITTRSLHDIIGDLRPEFLLLMLFPFAVGSLVTMFVDRTISGLMATSVMTVALAALIITAANVIQLRDNSTDYGIWGLFAIVTLSCFGMSYRILQYGESLKTRKRFQLLFLPGLADFLIIGIALIAAYCLIVS